MYLFFCVFDMFHLVTHMVHMARCLSCSPWSSIGTSWYKATLGLGYFFGGGEKSLKRKTHCQCHVRLLEGNPFQKVIYFEAHTCITTGYFIQLASWVLTLQLRHSQHNYMKMCVSLLHHRWSMCLNISIPCLTFTHWIPGVGAIYLTEKLLTNRLANR